MASGRCYHSSSELLTQSHIQMLNQGDYSRPPKSFNFCLHRLAFFHHKKNDHCLPRVESIKGELASHPHHGVPVSCTCEVELTGWVLRNRTLMLMILDHPYIKSHSICVIRYSRLQKITHNVPFS